MGPTSPPLERLHDPLLLLIIGRITERHDTRSFSQTCMRHCRLVRTSRRFQLQLGLHHGQALQNMPASRAYKDVTQLEVELQQADIQEGCWDALGSLLASSVERWAGIEHVQITGEDSLNLQDEPAGCLAAPLAGLKGAANLKRLNLQYIADTTDLPHLEQLTQVEELYLGGPEGANTPLILDHPPRAPLAALSNLKRLELPWAWSLTGSTAHGTFHDFNCPLALPPHLASLEAMWIECAPGSLWRHIAACKDLEELELREEGQSARSHPSWGLQELAGSLTSLKKLVLMHEGVYHNHGARRMRHLLHLLYLPQQGNMAPEVLEAALQQAVPPVPVAGLEEADPLDHMMLPPPAMGGFSSLETLQLPGGIGSSWWLMCSAPHHWQALAGCQALRQLEGLHASQPPPAEVKFPGITRLGVTVAPGDTVKVLRAFPALRDLKITSVVGGGQGQIQGEAAGPPPAQPSAAEPPQPASRVQQQLAAAAAAQARQQQQAVVPPPVMFPGVTRLTIDPNPLCISSSKSSTEEDPGAASAYCSMLWRALPGLKEVELYWQNNLTLPSLAALTGLTSLALTYYWRVKETELEVPAVVEMLQGAPGLQQVVFKVGVLLTQGQREQLVEEVHQVLPNLKQLQLE